MVRKRYKPIITYRLREIPVKKIKVWKSAQARTLNRDGIAELAKSIKNDGLQNPPMVQKDGDYYLLMSGQRRLSAMKRLGAKVMPALVLTKKTSYDVDTAKAASVVENLHRADMDTKDTAAACVFLAEQMGKGKAAKMLGMSATTFRKYHGFAGVPDVLKALVPRELSRDEAVTLFKIYPNTTNALKIFNRIKKIDRPTRKAYLKVLAHRPNSSHKKALREAKESLVRKKFSVVFALRNAKSLKRKCEQYKIAPEKLVSKVVSQWLREHRN